MTIFFIFIVSIFTSLALILTSLLTAVISSRTKRKKNTVGFFHPYTNDGGVGERVLWCAVRAIQELNPDLDVAVYTVDDTSPSNLASRAQDRFGVELLRPLKVVHLSRQKWIEEKTYPHFTMVGQSLGSVCLSWEALRKFTPQIYFDTSGYAFTYPLGRIFGCKDLPLERHAEIPVIISVAQFRPEKAHTLQLEAFSLAIQRLDPDLPKPKLQFVGSCRHEEDQERLQKLKDESRKLNVDKHVEFHQDVKYRDLIQLLGGAIAGLHSMIDEHFGISVVEYMAAGAIPVAHNSAGPRMDIVLNEDGCETGFLASTTEEYANAILKILKMPEVDRLRIAAAARKRASRFSEQKFFEDFKSAVSPILSHPKVPR